MSQFSLESLVDVCPVWELLTVTSGIQEERPEKRPETRQSYKGQNVLSKLGTHIN